MLLLDVGRRFRQVFKHAFPLSKRSPNIRSVTFIGTIILSALYPSVKEKMSSFRIDMEMLDFHNVLGAANAGVLLFRDHPGISPVHQLFHQPPGAPVADAEIVGHFGGGKATAVVEGYYAGYFFQVII